MSISAVNGVTQATQQTADTQAITPAPAVTPFSQQMDDLSGQTGAARGHHHHHGTGSQSVTTSLTAAASASGVATTASQGSSLLNLLS
jgi:hypothetical protein